MISNEYEIGNVGPTIREKIFMYLSEPNSGGRTRGYNN